MALPLLCQVTGQPLPALLSERITAPLGLPPTDLTLALGDGELPRVTKLSARAFGGQAAVAQLMSAASETDVGDGEEGGEDGGEGDASLVDRFSAAQQLANPASFNMRQLQRACVPGASMHTTAHALASFYAALADGRRAL